MILNSATRSITSSLLQLVALISLGSALPLAHAEKSLCTVSSPEYKIINSTLIAVHCSEDVSLVAGTANLYDVAKSPVSPAATALPVHLYLGSAQWLLVSIAPSATFQYGKKYQLALALHLASETSPPPRDAATVSIEINSTISVTPVVAFGSASQFEFTSHVAFKGAPLPNCILEVQDFLHHVHPLDAQCRSHAVLDDPASVTIDNLARWAITPEDLGDLILQLRNGNKDAQQLPFAVDGLIDVFGNIVKIDAKSQIAPEKAPSNKDASSYYFNFNHAAAKGSKPAWILDAKVAPRIGRLHDGFQFVPLGTADVGQNQISGITYTDTIDLGPSFTRIFEPNDFLQEILFSAGATYETDKEFDRDNVLFIPDARLDFVNLYNPRSRRTLEKFSEELAYAQCKRIPPNLKPEDCHPIPWSAANTEPVLMGYALDFHMGTEIGSSIIDTKVKNSTGTASLTLPSYPIVRIVPQVHGLWEIGRLSFDVTGTPRFLTTVENSVLERPNHSLYLRRDHGWFAYGVLSGTWTFDPAGHFGLTLAYKDGFCPPKFARVNTVQTGFTVKY